MPSWNPFYAASLPASNSNWLDSITRDISFLDPRAYEVHKTTWPPLTRKVSPGPPRATTRNVARIPKNICPRFHVYMWIEKTAAITTKGAHLPIPVDEIQMIEDGVYSSDDDSWDVPVPNTIQLEAIPPYPRQGLEDIDVLPYWESPRNFERPSIFHEEFGGSTAVDSTLSPTCTLPPTLHLGEAQVGIGSLIVGKVRGVVRNGREVCQCLRRKIRRT